MNYIKNFLLIAAVICIAIIIVTLTVPAAHIPPVSYFIVLLMTAVVIFVTNWQISTISKSASRFVSSFSGGMGLKFFITILILIPTLLLLDKGKLEVGVVTIVTYLALMVENVRLLLTHLRNQE